MYTLTHTNVCRNADPHIWRGWNGKPFYLKLCSSGRFDFRVCNFRTLALTPRYELFMPEDQELCSCIVDRHAHVQYLLANCKVSTQSMHESSLSHSLEVDLLTNRNLNACVTLKIDKDEQNVFSPNSHLLRSFAQIAWNALNVHWCRRS